MYTWPLIASKEVIPDQSSSKWLAQTAVDVNEKVSSSQSCFDHKLKLGQVAKWKLSNKQQINDEQSGRSRLETVCCAPFWTVKVK